MKGESEAVSSFAKSKTLKQQREFLPIYAVRQKVRQRRSEGEGRERERKGERERESP